ncbi:MAG: serine hydrolase domain-containing protein [Burkholderiaceae bacterium]
MDFPLVSTPIEDAPQPSLGLRASSLQPLYDAIQDHIAKGRYPGCQIALAWQGRLLVERSFGMARLGRSARAESDPLRAPDAQGVDDQALEAQADHLWLLYSNTKVLMATALWKLAETGRLRFADPVADYLPDFARHGKGDITIYHLITHQAGFPNAEVPASMWHDMAQVAAFYADVVPDWPAGSRVHYHGLSAHWVLALIIESVTGMRFQDAVRRLVLEPLGLAEDLLMGISDKHLDRMTYLYEPDPSQPGNLRLRSESTSQTWQRTGVPGGGAYGTARGMAALYQMMLMGGCLNGQQWISPRTLAYAIRNHTGDRVYQFMGMTMHRGLGPHLRGHSLSMRGLGDIAPPEAFGHGGVGTSYCWADPTSGVSFAYISNARIPEPWHSWRLNQIANLVHAAIRPIT